MNSSNKCLGLDLAGVIVQIDEDAEKDKKRPKNTSQILPFDGALQVIKKLKEVFGERIFIISVAKEEREKPTVEWLSSHGFLEVIPQEKIFFCRQRNEKGAICEQLGVTHFVDDQPEVLFHLKSVPNKYLFCPSFFRPRDNEFSQKFDGVKVSSWAELEEKLLS